jgi:photosystem II stability/assembly factor-like uncharacterized protein
MNKETYMPDIVYALAISPNFSQDNVCFAARQSGLYRSEDGGLHWHLAYETLNLDAPLAATAVAVSPDFETDHSVFAGAQGGVLRSVDGGRHWHIASFPSPPPFVSTLAVSPNFTQDGVMLAGTMEDGVFRSADRGSHWSRWNFGLLDLHIYCLALSPDFAHDETLFAGTESGIFRSKNGGRAWREVNFPIEFAPVLSLALSPNYAASGVLFAGTESSGLFFSTDQGRTWARLGQDRITDAVNGIVLSPVFPAKPDILAVLSAALSISRDGGQSWSDWKARRAFEGGITCVATPDGLAPDARLLVGLIEGGVLRV